MYSPLRVSTRIVSPSSMKSGTWTTNARLERRRLAAAAGGGVALEPGSVWRHLHVDRARDLDVARLLVDEEDSTSALGSTHFIESPSASLGFRSARSRGCP
jgi:hypothetical protein